MTALFWTPLAIRDREQVYSYIEADKPTAALDELFEAQAVLLTAQPKLGKLGRVAGTRELVVHKNYILVYDLQGGSVRILRILHVAMKWPPA